MGEENHRFPPLLSPPWDWGSGGIRLGHGTLLTLTEDDAAATSREVAAVEAAAPTMRGTAQVVFGNQNWSTVIQAATPEYLLVREWPLESGRAFTHQDVDGATKVALLG